MPDREELESILDHRDAVARRDRCMPWFRGMEPTPESDEAEEQERSEGQ